MEKWKLNKWEEIYTQKMKRKESKSSNIRCI